jgi:hypothetical protein
MQKTESIQYWQQNLTDTDWFTSHHVTTCYDANINADLSDFKK